jgi:hypothetical protein
MNFPQIVKLVFQTLQKHGEVYQYDATGELKGCSYEFTLDRFWFWLIPLSFIGKPNSFKICARIHKSAKHPFHERIISSNEEILPKLEELIALLKEDSNK